MDIFPLAYSIFGNLRKLFTMGKLHNWVCWLNCLMFSLEVRLVHWVCHKREWKGVGFKLFLWYLNSYSDFTRNCTVNSNCNNSYFLLFYLIISFENKVLKMNTTKCSAKNWGIWVSITYFHSSLLLKSFSSHIYLFKIEL